MSSPTSEQLYEINDAVTALADRFDVKRRRGLEDEEFYEMLDDATHAVAEHLFGAE